MTESAPLSSPGAEAILKRIVDVINAARPMHLLSVEIIQMLRPSGPPGVFKGTTRR